MTDISLRDSRPAETAARQTKSGTGMPLMMRSTPAIRAALFVLVVGALSLGLSHWLPWLTAWPDRLTVPATKWIGTGITQAFEAMKPVARLFSAALSYPMDWANAILIHAPYSLTIGVLTALAWHLGRTRLAGLVLAGLGFVLLSGYWMASMNTLALVCVSVPFAILVGSAIGILANEIVTVRKRVETLLDFMQTVPTFAYLTPLLLLFGFGPVVGLIASVIFAAPPMARNVMLALERVEPDIKEAAVMNGATRLQQLFLIEIPAASRQIMVGVNQTIMAALSMVIIAAVIGGFNDIGWEVLLNMRKAAFGQSLLSGIVIVIFAILADRMSARLTESGRRGSMRIALAILAVAIFCAVLEGRFLPAPEQFAAFRGLVTFIDTMLSSFTVANGALLGTVKNGAMYFILLPIRIGLAQSVLPFTWGFQWTPAMSAGLVALSVLGAIWLALRGHAASGICLIIATGMAIVGVVNLPWPFMLAGVGALGTLGGGWRLGLKTALMIAVIMVAGLWAPALLSIYLCTAAVVVCILVGGCIGVLSAVSERVWAVVRPLCDFLQTIPQFVFLIPVLMFFQIGEFSAFLAICAYAVVPMIRYTRQGLTSIPEDMLESAVSSGASDWQILKEVRLPYSLPTILLGLNQTILFAFSMLVIAALIGTTDLGQQIYLALGQGDVGLGVSAGMAMAMLALVADRLVQAFASSQKRALGL